MSICVPAEEVGGCGGILGNAGPDCRVSMDHTFYTPAEGDTHSFSPSILFSK